MDSFTPTIRPELLEELLIGTGPVSVWSVLSVWPLRLLPLPRPSASLGSKPRCSDISASRIRCILLTQRSAYPTMNPVYLDFWRAIRGWAAPRFSARES
jgi:hypothetical protein